MRVAYTIRGTGVFFHYEYRITAAKWAKQSGPVGRANLRVQKQWPERKDLVQGKRSLRADLLQMAEEDICNG